MTNAIENAEYGLDNRNTSSGSLQIPSRNTFTAGQIRRGALIGRGGPQQEALRTGSSHTLTNRMIGVYRIALALDSDITICIIICMSYWQQQQQYRVGCTP